jgi:hypothetical protein
MTVVVGRIAITRGVCSQDGVDAVDVVNITISVVIAAVARNFA